MPPPELRAITLWVATSRASTLAMPPPPGAELSDTALCVRVSGPWFSMPTPDVVDAFPATVQLTRVSVPKLMMPPPWRSVFPFRSARFVAHAIAGIGQAVDYPSSADRADGLGGGRIWRRGRRRG